MPIEVIPEQYRTSDGGVYTDRNQAEAHEEALETAGDLSRFFRKTGIAANKRKESEYKSVIVAYLGWLPREV